MKGSLVLKLKGIGFSEEELATSISLFKIRQFRKNEIILNLGEVCRFIGFLTKGHLKIFAEDHESDSQTRYIYTQGEFPTILKSFNDLEPSTEGIQALTDGELLFINREDYVTFTSENKRLHNAILDFQSTLLNKIIEEKNIIFQRNAKDRYLYFLENRPYLCQNIAIKEIASYLGIKRQSLSRIRRQINQKS